MLLLAASLACLGATSLQAQTPQAKPKGKPAFVRFWNMLPDAKKDDLELYIAAGQRLITTWASDTQVSYTPVLPGTFTFSVRRVGEENKDVKTPSVPLLADSFVTILATQRQGQIALDVLNETIDPAKEDGTGHLTVRQFCVGTRALVTVGATPAKPLNYGEASVFDGLASDRIPVTIQATLPNGTTRTMNTGTDFTKNHHATLLLVNDAYGRFRPAFSYDGYSDVNLSSLVEH